MQSSSTKPTPKSNAKPKSIHQNGMTAAQGHSDADRELKAYIYQQLVDIQPFLVPDSQMAVTVQHVLPAANSPESNSAAPHTATRQSKNLKTTSGKGGAKQLTRTSTPKRSTQKMKAKFLETSVAGTATSAPTEPTVTSTNADDWLNTTVSDSSDETSSAVLLAEAAEAGIVEIPAGGVYVVKLVATLDGGKLEVEGHGQNVYQAFGEAKGNMVHQLNEINNALMDPTEREEEIQSFLRGERTLH